MAGLIFLLVRILFRRREVAVIAAILVLVDGMLFVQSRIGMNDVYVGLFIVAAYTLFAPIWTGRWRSPWAFWVVAADRRGSCSGSALASKWIALYAIAGIAVLILGRSALGSDRAHPRARPRHDGPRLHGPVRPEQRRDRGRELRVRRDDDRAHPRGGPRDRPPPDRLVARGDPARDRRPGGPRHPGVPRRGPARPGDDDVPVRLARRSTRSSWRSRSCSARSPSGRCCGSPRCGASGRSPRCPAPTTRSGSPSPARRRRRAGSGRARCSACRSSGRSICLGVIPIAVYVVSYLPWAALGNQLIGTCAAGHELPDAARPHRGRCTTTTTACGRPTRRRRRTGPGRSTSSRSGSTRTASRPARRRAIYDAGNLVAWWLSIPAMAFVAWQAFARRSLALGLVVRRVRVPVDAVGPDRPGHLPVPLLRGDPVPAHRARLLHRRAAQRAVAPDVGAGPGRGRGRPSSGRP